MLTVFTYLLVVVEIICSVMLIGVILLQRTKGQGGMGGLAFGGGMGEALFGWQVGNVLTKTTVILAIIFLVDTALLAYVGTRRQPGSVTDSMSVNVPAATTRVPGARQPDDPISAGGAPGPAQGLPISAPATPMPAVATESPVPPAAMPGAPGPVIEIDTQPAMPVPPIAAPAPVSPPEAPAAEEAAAPPSADQ